MRKLLPLVGRAFDENNAWRVAVRSFAAERGLDENGISAGAVRKLLPARNEILANPERDGFYFGTLAADKRLTKMEFRQFAVREFLLRSGSLTKNFGGLPCGNFCRSRGWSAPKTGFDGTPRGNFCRSRGGSLTKTDFDGRRTKDSCRSRGESLTKTERGGLPNERFLPLARRKTEQSGGREFPSRALAAIAATLLLFSAPAAHGYAVTKKAEAFYASAKLL